MNKFLRIIIASVALASMQAAAQEDILPVPRDILKRYCIGLMNSYKCAQAIEAGEVALRYQSRVARCRPGTLCIKLATKTIEISDKATNTDQELSYSYIAFIPALKVHVLHTQLYEGIRFMVIHDDSGQTTDTMGYPVPSPDNKRFATRSMDMIAGYSPNGVEVWRSESGRFHREATFETEWGPSSATWRTPERIVFGKHCHDEERPGETKPCGKAELNFASNRWVFR